MRTHPWGGVRVFTQFQSGLEDGRVGGPRLTGKDNAEIHQAFVDISTGPDPNKGVSFRAGRQEFEFGSGHFIPAGEVLNVRRTFDGFKLSFHPGSWTALAIAARPALTRADAFADVPDHQQTLWGLGALGPNPLFRGANLSIYYIGLDRKVFRVDQGAGRDRRHTVGSRTRGKRGSWDYNYELVFQLGRFGEGGIHGAGSGERYRIHFRENEVQSAPIRSRKRSARCFRERHMRARSACWALEPDGHTPTLRLRLHRRVYFLPEDSFLWRNSLNDGIYGPTGPLTRTGTRSRFAGRFLKETPLGRSVTYGSSFLTYKF